MCEVLIILLVSCHKVCSNIFSAGQEKQTHVKVREKEFVLASSEFQFWATKNLAI